MSTTTPSHSTPSRVYMLRILVGMPPRPGFQALVRPVESEHWLDFNRAEDLVAYLMRHNQLSSEEQR